MLCHLQDALVHRQVIVAGGDYEVRPFNQTVFIRLIVMYKSSARCFHASDAFPVVGLCMRADMSAQNVRIVKEVFDELDAGEYLDKTGIVVVERAQHGASLEAVEFRPLFVCKLGADSAADVQPGCRAYPVQTVRIACGLEIWRLEI